MLVRCARFWGFADFLRTFCGLHAPVASALRPRADLPAKTNQGHLVNDDWPLGHEFEYLLHLGFSEPDRALVARPHVRPLMELGVHGVRLDPENPGKFIDRDRPFIKGTLLWDASHPPMLSLVA